MTGVVPAADAYFEDDGDGYLPIDYVEGEDLEAVATRALAGRSWRSLSVNVRREFFAHLKGLVAAVKELHHAGYVHRDLTAANVWITQDGRVLLLDLELTHAPGDLTPPFGMGTPGFVSPQQEAGEPPVFADDIYALGCVMILVFTGLDPRRVCYARNNHRIQQLQTLTGGMPHELAQILTQCLNEDPLQRPDLATLQAVLQKTTPSTDDGQEISQSSSARKHDARLIG